MAQQLNIQGKTKEQEAIEFIRENEPNEGYAVFYSGGKDSEIILHLAKMAGVRFKAFYSMMPDPPELITHIKKYHPEVIFLYPKISFYGGIKKLYPPHRKSRWCCDHLKERPGKKVSYIHRLVGIRAEEGSNRAKQGHINKFTKNRINYHPIFNWLEWEVWEYIDRYNIPYCKLYDEGFDRIGCVVCPLRAPSKAQELYRQRYPKHFERFERCVEQWWEAGGWWRQTKRRYVMLLDEFIANWYQGR
jgi:phosphoadenosine phosphosulfate reductase